MSSCGSLGHTLNDYLIDLTHRERDDPNAVKSSIAGHPSHPRFALNVMIQLAEVAEFSLISHRTFGDDDYPTAIDHHEGQGAQKKEVGHEVAMVESTHTIAYPRAMMIKLGHASIAHRTVLRSAREGTKGFEAYDDLVQLVQIDIGLDVHSRC